MTMQTVALFRLVPPSANPRKAVGDAAAIEGLASSIKADGLLHNLVVRPVKKGRAFEIVSGARRYRALKLLQERGDIDRHYPVPVEVRKNLKASDALRLATVENIQREALNAMDEAEAFAGLLAGGEEIADVAARAGVSEITVKRRLSLASLCAEARETVRAGEMKLSVAEALTLGTLDQQRDMIARMEEGDTFDGEDVRALLIDDKPSVAMARFPLERYAGTTTTDLFGEDTATFFDDVEQFLRLQAHAVEEMAERLRGEFAWVEVIRESYVAWWQYEAADEGEEAGAVIQFTPAGRVSVREGLRKRPVREDVVRSTRVAPKAAKVAPAYSAALIRNLTAHKSLAVQAELLANPRKAKEVAVIQMMTRGDRASRVKAEAHPALTTLKGDRPSAYVTLEQEAARLRALLHDQDGTPEFDPSNEHAWDRLLNGWKDSGALYEAVKRLSDDDLDRLHVLLTTLAFGEIHEERFDTGDSLFNRVAIDLGVDMRRHWRPDEAFLARRNKEQLQRIARQSGALGEGSTLKGFTKKAAVLALARHFERCRDNPESELEGYRKGRDWLPDVMLFPAVVEGAAPEPVTPTEEQSEEEPVEDGTEAEDTEDEAPDDLDDEAA